MVIALEKTMRGGWREVVELTRQHRRRRVGKFATNSRLSVLDETASPGNPGLDRQRRA